MNIALVLAAGRGERMGYDIPKQFIEIREKPVLIYTLESLQAHPCVDAILCVCLKGWENRLSGLAKAYGIEKLKWITEGGSTSQESIRNGVYFLEDKCTAEDMIIVHDGIRPLVEPDILTDVVRVCEGHGNAVTSLPYNEQIFVVDSEQPETTISYIPRETLRRVSTPQAYRFGLIDEAYHEAYEKEIGIYGSAYTNTMMVELGHRLFFASGSDRNIKLTTPGDLEIFEAMLPEEEDTDDDKPRFKCPCCGMTTLTERLEWEICPVCRWEDDTDENAVGGLDIPSGANHELTLSEARANYREFGNIEKI